MKHYDLMIIGGGAIGLFCAINSPKEYKKLILEKQNQLGTKILLSGGGRCNFSNKNISADKYVGNGFKPFLRNIKYKYKFKFMLTNKYSNIKSFRTNIHRLIQF